MGFGKYGSLIERITTTATSAGTTTLVNNSITYQEFTGTTTQTVVLPDTTTCPVGMKFVILNRSTGVVTVNFNGGTLALAISANSQSTFRVVANGTSIGTWDISNEASGSGGAGALSASQRGGSLAALAGSGYQDTFTTSKNLTFNQEEVGGDYWLIKMPLPVANNSNGGFALNGFGYSIGGLNGPGGLNTAYRYYDDTNIWLQTGNLTTIRSNIPAEGFVLNGFGYIAGGKDGSSTILASTDKYNDSLGTWSSVASLSAGKQFAANFTLTYGYFMGGMLTDANSSTQNVLELYNDVNNNWHIRAAMNSTRREFGAAALNNYGYAISGPNASGTNQPSVDKYVEATNYWTVAAPCIQITNQGLQGASAVSVNGSIYAGPGGGSLNYIQQYQDGADTWLSRAASSVQKEDYGAFGLNGTVYQAGNVASGPSTLVESYKSFSYFTMPSMLKSANPPSSIFVSAAIAALATSLHAELRSDGDTWHALTAGLDTALKTGEVANTKFLNAPLSYFAGGANSSSIAVQINELFNDNLATWTQRANMTTARYGGLGFPIAGNGLVFGGANTAGTNLTTNEKYTEITDTWSTRTSGITARHLSVSWSIKDIGYAVNGGGISGNTNVNESFNDTTNAWTSNATTATATTGSTGSALNDLGYICGGITSTVQTAALYYNPITNAYTTITSMPDREYAGTSFAANGFLYVVGGDDSSIGNGAATNSTFQYNQNTNAWATLATIATATIFASATMAAGNGYINGGSTNGVNVIASAQRYSTLGNVWTTITSIPTALVMPTAHRAGPERTYDLRIGVPAYYPGVGLGVWVTKANLNTGINTSGFNLNGIGYHIGWNNGGTGTEQYNLPANVWIVKGAVSGGTAVAYVPGCSFQGFGWRFGGNGSPVSQATDQFNDITYSWINKANVPTAVNLNGSSTLNGYGYSIGSSNAPSTPTYQYNPLTNAWATKSNVTASGGGGSLNLDALNGYVYYLNGNSAFYRYNDSADSWSTQTSYPLGTIDYNMGCSYRGQLWITGGYNGSTAVTIVNSYSDSTKIWSGRSNMNIANFAGGSFNLNGGIMQDGGGQNPTNTQMFEGSLTTTVLGAALRVS